MALMDEFKEERERIFKEGTAKEKIFYFWEYYKWYVIIPVIIVSVIVWYIHHIITAPDPLMNGVMLNAVGVNAEEMISEFCEEQEIDREEYSVELNTGMNYVANDDTGMANYESIQALMAWMGAGSVDFIAGDSEAVRELAYKSYFVDLREILSEEQLKKMEPYILYMDQSIIDEVNRLYEEDMEVPRVEYPDGMKPEEMEDAIPVMIDLSNCESLMEGYGNPKGGLAMGLSGKTEHVDIVLAFVDYIMEE